MNECSWPFHANSKECDSCRKYETMYGENLTRYMDEMAELKARQRADRAARRRIMRAGGSAPEQPGGV